MKKIRKAIVPILLGMVVCTNSCVDDINVGDAFLEKAPGVDVNIDTVFNKAEYTRNFLWTIYNKINYPFSYSTGLNGSPIEILSDIFHSHCSWSWGNEYWYPGLVTEDAQNNGQNKDKFMFQTSVRGGSQTQQSIWSAIRQAWILIENIERVPDMSEDEKSRLRGEAFTIMATRYFDGYKNFGGLPIIDHVYQTGETYTRGRATSLRTAEFIDSLLECAIKEPGLPFYLKDQDTEAGRITKGAAMALRAKLWMFAASPLFNSDQPMMDESTFRADEVVDFIEGSDFQNAGQKVLCVWHGGYHPELWQKCLQCCEDFFNTNAANGNPFALIQPESETLEGYRRAYRKAYLTQGNSEKLIEVHPFAPNQEEWGDQNTSALGNMSHQGHTNPTLEFMEMFPMSTGENYAFQGLYGTENMNNIDIFVNRDPRLYETMVVPQRQTMEDYMGMSSLQIWQGGAQFNNSNLNGWTIRFSTGMALFKYIFDYWKISNEPFSYSYMRMAEAHLIYAEALAQTGNLQKACDEVNKVRARVGLGKIETSNPQLHLTSDKNNLIQEILRERACELGFEDQRLYDIIRYKMEDKFTTPLHELQVWRKNADGSRNTDIDTQLKEGEPWPNFRYDKVEITVGHRAWWDPGFWSNKYYLSPLPRTEINKGYGLFQNPGW